MAFQAVSFSDVQLATLRIWRATRPFGLCVRIIRNSANAAVAAEVSHQGPTGSRWRLEASSDGTILLTGAPGAWAMGSIEVALENVSKFEAERRGLALQLQGSLMAGALSDGSATASQGVPG